MNLLRADCAKRFGGENSSKNANIFTIEDHHSQNRKSLETYLIQTKTRREKKKKEKKKKNGPERENRGKR
jgi:hypothetical protein